MIGKTISHYRILEKLGAGGMGEVYRAEDANLSRQVAIKVLPEFFAKDPERLARFAREARLLASLNHPNIAAIHGLEEVDGKRFLIMELVEGKTLAELLSKGPLAIEEALDVCRQIAEGLETAHEKGVIHRDLKPANVKITPDGKVKILDFGLAKAMADEPSSADASQSPTITEAMTRPGVILGTAAYMSPEQAKGKPLDKRTDIWAFVCLLFECLTGKRAFEGESVSETLAAILKGEPDWQLLPAATPWRVKGLLHRCLKKDPKERLHDIADARIEIQDAASRGLEDQLGVSSKTLRWPALPWVLFVVTVLVAVALALQLMMLPERTSMPTRRFSIPLPQPLAEWEVPSLAISPDGMQLAYFGGSASSGSTISRLYCMRLDQAEFKLMPGAEGGYSPFFSPDGKEIGFFSEGRLKKLPVAGGAVVILTDLLGTFPGGGSWESDGYIYFSMSWGSGVSRVRATGGVPEIILKPDPGKNERGLLYPQYLPKDDLLLSTAFRGDISTMMDANIAISRMGNRPEGNYLVGGTNGRYLPTGHLVYAYGDKLMAVGLDLTTRKTAAKTATALEGIEIAPSIGVAQLAVSDTGDLVYAPGTLIKCRDSLVQIDRSGKQDPLSFPIGENEDLYVSSPSLSYDGKQLAVMLHKANNDIHIYNFLSKVLTRISYEPGDKWAPVWGPDGMNLLYTAETGPILQMIKKQLAGIAKSEPILGSENPRYPWSFSPDGKILAFVEKTRKTMYDIWTVQSRGEGPPRPFKNTAYTESYPAFSPDGHWIAYQSDQSGQKQVYVAKYPDGSDEKQISSDGGTEPRWASSGELFYLSGNFIKAVKTSLNPAFSFGAVINLFTIDESLKLQPTHDFPVSTYAVTPDGQKFYFIKKNRAAPVTQLQVVLNWFEELKRIVPVK